MAEAGDQVDESLYSRQLYAIGAEAQRRLQRTDVLVVGLTGLGMELTKNVTLTGLRSVTLADPAPVGWSDLSSGFYFKPSDAEQGRNRVEACIDQLQELNMYSSIRHLQAKGAVEETITEWATAAKEERKGEEGQQLVAVVVDHCTTKLQAANAACREHGVKFIATESRGLAGLVFVDNGEKHMIHDTDGIEPKTYLVPEVVAGSPPVITASLADGDVVGAEGTGLQDGACFMFFNTPELAAINSEGEQCDDPKLFFIKAKTKWSFELYTDAKLENAVDGTSFQYAGGGYCKRVKLPEEDNFLPLAESVDKPDFPDGMIDFSKFGSSPHLHCLFLGLHDFHQEEGRLPTPHDDAEAAKVAALASARAKAFPDFGGECDEAVVKQLAAVSAGNLCPVAAFLGGLAAHEVLKAASGKYRPIKQWFYFDARECLMDPPPAPETCQPQQSRYDGQIAVFGSEYQKRMEGLRYFVVGSGALGCELLKNFAMTGACCSDSGELVITDMDTIEKSNLSRQFLFRNKDVGSWKAKAATAAAQVMNPAMRTTIHCTKVAPDTEHIFTDSFWKGLDGVVNALDNIKARLYVDDKCLEHKKSLLESGTTGSRCNLTVVVPMMTQTFGQGESKAPEAAAASCTLKSFPTLVEHTVAWSKDRFGGTFTKIVKDTNDFLADPALFIRRMERESPQEQMATMQDVYSCIEAPPKDFDDCIRWARRTFEELFTNEIKQLLHNLPLDKVDEKTGEKFWSGTKRPPTPAQFSADDETHVGFIIAAANLRAFCYGIIKDTRHDGVRDAGRVMAVATSCEVKPFAARQQAVQLSEGEAPPAAEDVDPEALAKMRDELTVKKEALPTSTDPLMTEVDFEKDDDTNFHMQFITACSNLRARSYNIPEADQARTKKIAGNIIPAMVTTTALVCGLVGLEMYKLVMGGKKLEDYKAGFIDLAIPTMNLFEPSGDKEVWEQKRVKHDCKGRARKEYDSALKKNDLPDGVEMEEPEPDGGGVVWWFRLTGPEGSPYAPYRFNVKVTLSDEYPYKPPVFKFTNVPYHPTVYQTGREAGLVCAGALGLESWGPSNTCPGMFRQLLAMLQTPQEFAGHAVETDIMAQLQASEDAFAKEAAARAKKHALPPATPEELAAAAAKRAAAAAAAGGDDAPAAGGGDATVIDDAAMLAGLEYPDGAKFLSVQELSAERRAIYAEKVPELASGGVAAVLCDEDGEKVQHLVHLPAGGAPKVIIIEEACKIMYDDLPPSRIVEYRFDDGGWMLSGMSLGACEMYRGQKYKQWMTMLEKPTCEAALRRMVEAGMVNRLYDTIVLPTPEADAAKYEVTDEKTGKTINIPHPVKELRTWDADAGEYKEITSVLEGAPEDAGAPQAWLEILDMLRQKLGAPLIDGIVGGGDAAAGAAPPAADAQKEVKEEPKETFSNTAKVFQFQDKDASWTFRGAGTLRVINKVGDEAAGKVTLTDDAGGCLLSMPIAQGGALKEHSECTRALVWTGIDESPPAQGSDQKVTFCAKLVSADVAREFARGFEAAGGKPTDGPTPRTQGTAPGGA